MAHFSQVKSKLTALTLLGHIVLAYVNCSGLEAVQVGSFSSTSQESLDLPQVEEPRVYDHNLEPFQIKAGESLNLLRMRLVMQTDGNLVLYRSDRDEALWNSETAGRSCAQCFARFQSDGNLVLYDSAYQPYWSTNSQNQGGEKLVLQATFPFLQIMAPGDRVVWSSSPLEPFRPIDIERLQLHSPPRYIEAFVIDREQGTVIQGLAIGNRRHNGPCLIIRNSSNITVQQNEIFDCADWESGATQSILIENSNNIRIVRNNIHSTKTSNEVGIYIHNSRDVHVVDNQFYDTAGGVLVYRSSQIQVIKNRFQNMHWRAGAHTSFVQFNNVSGGGNRISCNIGYNENTIPHTGDLINAYQSNGVAGDPIWIYGNRLANAFDVNLSQPGLSSAGIQIGDGSKSSHIHAVANSIVNVGGGAMGVSGGDSMVVRENRILARRSPELWTLGIYAMNFYGTPGAEWAIEGAYCNNVHIDRNQIDLGESTYAPIWTENFGNNWPLCTNVSITNNDGDATLDARILDAVAPGCVGL